MTASTIFAQRGAPSFNRPGGFDTQQAPGSDTLERPPLEIKVYSTATFLPVDHDLDSTLDYVHLVETYYRSDLIGLNLGSENSALFPILFNVRPEPIPFGHNVYHSLFHETARDVIHETNRPYWDMHFGQGMIIGSSDFHTRFNRSFARNISFNFDYASLNDNGWRTNQSNNFRRLNIKFAQRSKGGNRMTYIQYDRPRIEESVRFDPLDETGSSLLITNVRRNFKIGNSISVRDTSSHLEKLRIVSTLDLYKTEFVSSSESAGSGQNLLLLDLGGNSLSYNHSLSGTVLDNKVYFPGERSTLSLGINLGLLSERQDTIIDNSYTQGVVSASYEKQMSESTRLGINAEFGLLDASGFIHSNFSFSFFRHDGLSLSLGGRYLKTLPALAHTQLYINNTRYQESDWSNVTEQAIILDGAYSPWNLDLSLGIKRFNNLVLVGSRGLFQQFDGWSNNSFAQAKYKLKIGPFPTEHTVLYQSVPSELLGLPDLYYRGNVYWEFMIFRKRLKARIGADIFYLPTFDTPEFFPITGEFTNYATNKNEQDIVIVNPYLSAQVQKFFFFVKGVNLTRQLYPTSINLVSNFPLYDYRIRFGVKWILLD